MKALITDNTHPILIEKLQAAGILCDVDTQHTYQSLLDCIDDYDALVVRSKIVIDAHFLDHCHRIKCIGRVGAGMETIDVAHAEQRGIRCLNSPEGNRDAVGEHALALLLALFDKICIANNEVRQGLWHREANRGLEVKGKTVGIIGFGNMGGAFAQRLLGFECDVIAYDILGTQATGFARQPQVPSVSLNELQKRADILSLHVPLTPQTHHMVNSDFIHHFDHPFYLINTSRGAVVDTPHLAIALQEGKILGAALDVIEYEDMSRDGLDIATLPPDFQYLLQAPNTIFTPHVGGWTVESKYKLAAVLADKIIETLEKC